jgi:inhibitor of KinA sporulation pathway (predicted exonuclease)
MKYCLVDFESTCSNDSSIEKDRMEIIEFAAAIIDKDTLLPISFFSKFVKPVIYPKLTRFCTDLTTITQDDVDNADNFPEVFHDFIDWLKPDNETIMMSWGAYDNKQLVLDLENHGLLKEYPFSQHINLKEAHRILKKAKRGFGMKSALAYENIEMEGIHHRGIDDVKNIAKLIPIIFSE